MAVACADEVAAPWDGRSVCGCGPMHFNRVVMDMIVDPLKL